MVGIICPLPLVGLNDHQNWGGDSITPLALFRQPWAHISAVAFTLFGLATPPVRPEFGRRHKRQKSQKAMCKWDRKK